MGKIKKIAFLGFLTWLVPFIVAFFFYSKDGQLTIDIFLFKSIMIIVGASTGASLLMFYFLKIDNNFLSEGIIAGLAWLAINLIMDFIVLLPMAKMTIGVYFIQIGLRYLIIPIMGISMGYILDKKIKH